MIIVNDPEGSKICLCPALNEKGKGAPTDFFFPFFLLLEFLFHFPQKKDSSNIFYKKSKKRTVIIFLLGIFLAFFPKV
ncbi:MAG: hypothetical protein CM15mP22_0100 [Gammaproteobacteria bacterium]|nr:MAG: hypothetical protein CM15mP22_0100 [Gammaproteobacteria bacterium]